MVSTRDLFQQAKNYSVKYEKYFDVYDQLFHILDGNVFLLRLH